MDYLHFRFPSVLSTIFAQEVVASFRATRLLLGIWCLLSALEWIRNVSLFKEDDLLSWRILSLRPGRLFREGRLQTFVWERSIAWVLGIRIAAAIGLMLTPDPVWQLLALLTIVTTSWFLTVRSWLGSDGAEQMGQIVSLGALMIAAGLSFDQLGLSFAGTLMIGGQLTISYFFAGFSKLFSANWRSGQALVGAMGTHSYGHGFAARIASGSVAFSAGLCWLVIVTETFFPLALFAPHTVLLFTLAAFFMFHVANAYFMGLNTFVWAFAATYPSVILLNDLITGALDWR